MVPFILIEYVRSREKASSPLGADTEEDSVGMAFPATGLSSKTDDDLALVIVIMFRGMGDGGGVTKWGGGVSTGIVGEVGEVEAMDEGGDVEAMDADGEVDAIANGGEVEGIAVVGEVEGSAEALVGIEGAEADVGMEMGVVEDVGDDNVVDARNGEGDGGEDGLEEKGDIEKGEALVFVDLGGGGEDGLTEGGTGDIGTGGGEDGLEVDGIGDAGTEEERASVEVAERVRTGEEFSERGGRERGGRGGGVRAVGVEREGAEEERMRVLEGEGLYSEG